MGPLSIPFPEINPVAVQFGPFAVKWYGLAYMAGLLLGWFYVVANRSETEASRKPRLRECAQGNGLDSGAARPDDVVSCGM